MPAPLYTSPALTQTYGSPAPARSHVLRAKSQDEDRRGSATWRRLPVSGHRWPLHLSQGVRGRSRPACVERRSIRAARRVASKCRREAEKTVSHLPAPVAAALSDETPSACDIFVRGADTTVDEHVATGAKTNGFCPPLEAFADVGD